VAEGSVDPTLLQIMPVPMLPPTKGTFGTSLRELADSGEKNGTWKVFPVKLAQPRRNYPLFFLRIGPMPQGRRFEYFFDEFQKGHIAFVILILFVGRSNSAGAASLENPELPNWTAPLSAVSDWGNCTSV
jgi:hypothetical protein